MYSPESPFRKKTREISVGPLKLGGNNPIRIQSMTTPKTDDVDAVVKQIQELEAAGCEIVRVTVNNQEAADALPLILEKVHIPVIADIHFDYKMALAALKHNIACVRINPGNIGVEWKTLEVLKAAQDKGVAIRIGVNAGSLEKPLLKKYGHPTPEALVESALAHIALFETHSFFNFKVSIKSSDVRSNFQAYSLLSQKTDAPLHLGVTEAGTKNYGAVKSAVGIGSLLLSGIGDTIRVSLSCDPVEEIKAGVFILKSLGLKNDAPEVIACPSCGRADIDVFRLAEEVERRVLGLKKNIKVAVMGCVVNGPGESMEADIGIAGGKGEGLIYKKGKPICKVPEDKMVDFLMDEISRM
ncbi:MAG: flavodoxin-dependent (E)-4-hydroxy-3-methylbut-2-enyl-diphosphate synthase [Deltaproteobacteria bacterium]|nr:flavodoxin-dependent (E)-4-hydroxy-3-methylbut-2-enyl-diphosphate synthase [Deltaproteobacteria bacterium]MBI3293108.1 flavodoxin-dependent (E)-4-hydroxy-3-methylbut-2-enyl-diphosphate synthase [Deltaproteobacteria bacterium]